MNSLVSGLDNSEDLRGNPIPKKIKQKKQSRLRLLLKNGFHVSGRQAVLGLIGTVVIFVIFLALVIGFAVKYNHLKYDIRQQTDSEPWLDVEPDNCAYDSDDYYFNPAPKSIQTTGHFPKSQKLYGGITKSEYDKILKFLFDDPELNLVPSANASLASNYVYTIDDYLPSKTETLAYLQDGQEPVRKVKVTLFMGATSPKSVKELIVWPVSEPSNKVEYVNPGNRKPSWQSRPVCELVELTILDGYLQETLAPLRPILEAHYGQWFGPDCGDKCIFYAPIPRVIPTKEDRTLYVFTQRNSIGLDDYYVYPADLTMIINTPGNGDDYNIVALYYNSTRYDNIELLLKDFNDGKFPPRDPQANEKFKDKFGSPIKRGPDFNPNNMCYTTQQAGTKRINVDGHHVQWLGYEFDFHFHTVSAANLMNIQFNKERVVYELGLQDIMVTYTGTDPVGVFRSYMDVGWSLGTRSSPLLRDYDCPSNAIYMSGYVYKPGFDQPIQLSDSACIFEYTNSVPLRRHFSTDFFNYGGYRFLFSMPDTVLVFRQIITVWNYDYVLDFEFHQNGVIQAKISSTGYIQVVARGINYKRKYGYDVSPDIGIIASLHSHHFLFKADMDIVDSANRFKTIDLGYETLTHRFNRNVSRSQYTMEERVKTTEQEAKLKYDFTQPKHYIIYNENRNNTFNGLPRGYRISSEGFAYSILPDDDLLLNAASWRRHQVAVTKQKDKEREAFTYYSQGDPYDPVVSLAYFQEDDESIVDEDLIAWVSVGMHHIPVAEDLPVTTTPGRTLAVTLSPFNFFPEDISISSGDALLKRPKTTN